MGPPASGLPGRPLVFLDSGIGSLPYAGLFHSRNPSEQVICLADRAGFPYGPKTKEELICRLAFLTEGLIALYDPAVLVLACNTATVSALSFLRERFPGLPVVGTVPAVKPAVLASRARRIGVLGTERTVEDPSIASLAGRYGPGCAVLGEAAPVLVEFVEHRYAASSRAERLEAVSPWIEKFRAAGADAVVLGCTHFLLLLDEFREACGKDLGVYHSMEGISRRVESLLGGGGGRPGAGGRPLLAVTGERPLETYWNEMAALFGFRAERAAVQGRGRGRLS
jgi:glutamate racemase